MPVTITRNYTVEGMNCEHCRAAVDEHVFEVEGVETVAVDLGSGLVEVSGSSFSDDAIKGAVEAAGFQLGDGQ